MVEEEPCCDAVWVIWGRELGGESRTDGPVNRGQGVQMQVGEG